MIFYLHMLKIYNKLQKNGSSTLLMNRFSQILIIFEIEMREIKMKGQQSNKSVFRQIISKNNISNKKNSP